jgi:hypothetical protein
MTVANDTTPTTNDVTLTVNGETLTLNGITPTQNGETDAHEHDIPIFTSLVASRWAGPFVGLGPLPHGVALRASSTRNHSRDARMRRRLRHTNFKKERTPA